MATMEYNGVTIEIDLMDADEMERYENLMKEISERIQEPTQYEGKKGSESMRMQCGMVKDFFDDAFGVGTASKLFEGKNSLGKCMEAFAIACNMTEQVREETQAISRKYMPERVNGNRDYRRASQKPKYKNSNRYPR